MKSYEVFFEFLGKKMKFKVIAEDEYKARQEIHKRINIHKVVCTGNATSEAEKFVNDLMKGNPFGANNPFKK